MPTKEELLRLYDINLEKLVSTAEKITNENFPKKEIDICSIISAKTGKCSENCKYCSQSLHNHADILCHPLLDVEEVKQAALKARENGAKRFCIVTSGRSEDDRDFKKTDEALRIREIPDGDNFINILTFKCPKLDSETKFKILENINQYC